MRRMALLVGLAGFMAFQGCTTTPVRVDTGAIKASTYDFVAGKPADFAENRAVVHGMIQDAIAGHLARKGLARVEGGGDIKVAYLVLLNDNVSTEAINDYFGYGRDDAELQDKAHQALVVDRKNPDAFESGTLVIDLIDAKSYKLLKRNFVIRPILKNIETDVRAARIKDAVEEALADAAFVQ